MGRTIEQIKREMTTSFVASEAIQKAYGLDSSKGFDEQFSKVSVESVIFYVVAVAMWAVESLFDTHKAEVAALVAQAKPHTLRWYVERAKLFQFGRTLADGRDTYDNSDRNEAEIEAERLVSFSAVEEIKGVVYLKVAKMQDNSRVALEGYELAAFSSYIGEIKDAGVALQIISQPGCHIKMQLEVFYNPMILTSGGYSIVNPEDGDVNYIVQAIKNFVENLPFNGEFVTSKLIDRLQGIAGVVVPEMRSVKYSNDGNDYADIDVFHRPYAGYYQFEPKNITIKYTAYEGAIA